METQIQSGMHITVFIDKIHSRLKSKSMIRKGKHFTSSVMFQLMANCMSLMVFKLVPYVMELVLMTIG